MAEQINKNEEAKNVSSDQTKHVSENRTVTQFSTTPGPEWRSIAKIAIKSYHKPEEDATSEAEAHVHTIIIDPTTFTKKQRAVLKDYATQMGGSYTNFKIVDKQEMDQ